MEPIESLDTIDGLSALSKLQMYRNARGGTSQRLDVEGQGRVTDPIEVDLWLGDEGDDPPAASATTMQLSDLSLSLALHTQTVRRAQTRNYDEPGYDKIYPVQRSQLLRIVDLLDFCLELLHRYRDSLWTL